MTLTREEARPRVTRGRPRRTSSGIGGLVKKARQNAGLSLKELAEGIGVSSTYLWKVETNAIKEPSGTVLVRLARAFGWTMDYLDYIFKSEEEKEIDTFIKTLETELSKDPKFSSLIRTSRPIQNTLRGKKVYLALLKELKELNIK